MVGFPLRISYDPSNPADVDLPPCSMSIGAIGPAITQVPDSAQRISRSARNHCQLPHRPHCTTAKMVSTVFANVTAPPVFKAAKQFSGAKVPHAPRLAAVRVNRRICASAKREAELAAAASAITAAILSTPLAAQATEATPSVNALLGSVVNGGIVAVLIVGAVTLVSGFDPVNRGR